MSNVTVTISVPDPASVLAQYDVVKVYRSILGPTGDYVEVSTPATRVVILADETTYEFDDGAGDPAYYYKTAYYNTATSAEGDLSSPVKGDYCGNYVSVQDLRDEGLTTAVLSDLRALALIQLYEDMVNQYCGQWFYPLAAELWFDGSGSTLLQLPVPIVQLDELYLNDSSTALEASAYVAYTGRSPGNDDRPNPRVKIKSTITGDAENFYRFVGGNLAETIFKRGERNQRLKGVFGYIEPDGTAPLLIKYAVRKLISLNYAKLGLGGATAQSGPVTKEVTDRHSISYSEKMLPASTVSGDPEVDRILVRYRRPPVISRPYGELL